MGIANCPETPRQKMIGMMYLVLTAMLALNVSNEVLDAFALVNKGLAKTNESFEQKNYSLYSDFENKHMVNAAKVGVYWNKAQQIRNESQKIYDKVEDVKLQIARNAGMENNDPNNIKRKDDREAASFMLKKKKAENLKNDIEEFRNFLTTQIPSSDISLLAIQTKSSIVNGVNTNQIIAPDGMKIPWVQATFEDVPAISCITMMTKIQNDIRNAEFDIINYLYQQIESKSYKFTSISGRVIGPNYMLRGSDYSLDIFVAAMDTTQESMVKLGRNRYTTKDGVFEYKLKPTTLGSQKIEGIISFKDPNGMEIPIPFEHSYQVVTPSAVVSPTKMNVFYAGIRNPIETSAPGIPQSELRRHITNGRFVGSGKNLAVIPTAAPGNKCRISLRSKDGVHLGTKEFRIRRIPDPIAMIGNKKGGRISKVELLAQLGVDAILENFNFDLKFNVRSFTVSSTIGGFTVEEISRSDRFTRKQKSLMERLKRGQKVYIEDVVATGPDGSTRRLPAISLRII